MVTPALSQPTAGGIRCVAACPTGAVVPKVQVNDRTFDLTRLEVQRMSCRVSSETALRKRDFKRAAGKFEVLQRIDPRNRDPNHGLALTYGRTGKLADALAAIDRALPDCSRRSRRGGAQAVVGIECWAVGGRVETPCWLLFVPECRRGGRRRAT
jgi:hypothetical protein